MVFIKTINTVQRQVSFHYGWLLQGSSLSARLSPVKRHVDDGHLSHIACCKPPLRAVTSRRWKANFVAVGILHLFQ